MPTYLKEDLRYGELNEIKYKSMLEKYFNCTLINTKDTLGRFCPWDFENKDGTIRIEIKSRRVAFTAYPTSVIGYSKLFPAREFDGDYYFCFVYKEGIYGVKYSKKFQDLQPKRFNRYNGEVKRNIEIPCSWLTRYVPLAHNPTGCLLSVSPEELASVPFF